MLIIYELGLLYLAFFDHLPFFAHLHQVVVIYKFLGGVVKYTTVDALAGTEGLITIFESGCLRYLWAYRRSLCSTRESCEHWQVSPLLKQIAIAHLVSVGRNLGTLLRLKHIHTIGRNVRCYE